MKEAPVFVQAYDLYRWLLARAASWQAHPALTAAMLARGGALLEAVTLACGGFSTGERVAEADEHAAVLRVHLRLLADEHLLDDRQLLFAAGELAGIGRQLGGWRKRLDRVA